MKVNAFHKNITYNEERRLETKQYDNCYIDFYTYFLNNSNIKSHDFEFIYNEDEFYIEDLYFKDVTNISFIAVPVKIGNFKINIKAFGYSFILNLKVNLNDTKYENDIDLNKYSELKSYLDGIKYHEFKNSYQGLKDNRYYKEFDDYISDYKNFLMDSCYYPSYFPSAPKNSIMKRYIEMVSDSEGALDNGCDNSSIHYMNIGLYQIDPDCIKPQDRVATSIYNMVKLEDAFKFHNIMTRELVSLKYNLVKPILYDSNGLVFYIVRENDNISVFLSDEKYLYSFYISYDMTKS